jgi:hypothetical protein
VNEVWAEPMRVRASNGRSPEITTPGGPLVSLWNHITAYRPHFPPQLDSTGGLPASERHTPSYASIRAGQLDIYQRLKPGDGGDASRPFPPPEVMGRGAGQVC